MSLHEVRVAEVVDQGHRQRAIRLEPIGAELPAFEAGAHVDLHLPDGLVRQYSIASAPHARDHYLLCVKLADASRGGSRHLCEQLAAGDRLQISTPRNLFPLHPGERHVLLAAGIGITPLLSMAEALEARGEAFVLHYYARRQADVAFEQRLQQGFQHGQVQVHLSDGARARVCTSPPNCARHARVTSCICAGRPRSWITSARWPWRRAGRRRSCIANTSPRSRRPCRTPPMTPSKLSWPPAGAWCRWRPIAVSPMR